MSRIGLFGGSFNPPHVGHLIVAEQARVQAFLDRVIWIPAHQSPHKTGDDLVAAHHRLAMVHLAVEGHDAFDVSDLELHRPGPSFTVDTVRAMQAEHPGWELHLVLGGDSLAGFSTWREPDVIRKLAHLVVYPRGDRPSPALPDDRADIVMLDVPLIPIASSDLRRRAASGGSIRYFVPESVHRYVADHGLYR